jgi:ubiquinone/menaquinone biosynthesis C-methylase UbiE
MSKKTTQYDDMADLYDLWSDSCYNERLIGSYNRHKLLQPVIRGAKVLDLACGTGFLTNHLIAWGAGEVVGVDISSGMIEIAKRNTPHDASKVTFLVGDGSVPVKYYDQKPFDIVTANWLLNYAADFDQMVSMFRNIAMNVKEGGLFMGVVFKPHPDPASLFPDADHKYHFGTDETHYLKLVELVDDGIRVKCFEVGVDGKEGSYE